MESVRDRRTRAAATTLCPYCGREFGGDTGRSKDHLFGEAFGGRLTVPACKPCNSTIGHSVEARLHRPDTVHAFARAGAELPGRPLRARFSDTGEEALLHRGIAGSAPRHPGVRLEEHDGEVTGEVVGTEAQVKKVWKDLRKRYADFPDLQSFLGEGTRRKAPVREVRMEVVMRLPDAHRLAAKVALGGGALLWGDTFSASALADGLRAILRADDGLYESSATKLDLDYPQALLEIVKNTVPVALPDIGIPLSGDRWISQLVLCPVHTRQSSASTGIFVHILNMPTPFYGLIVPGTLPGSPVCPAVVREELRGEVRTWILDRILFEAIDNLYERNPEWWGP